MPPDLSDLTAASNVVTIGGKDYRVRPFQLRDVGEFLAYVKELHPNPLLVARGLIQGLPDAVATHIWDRAEEKAKDWPPKPGGPEFAEAMMGAEGQARIAWIALRRTVAGFTLEDARALSDAMTDREADRLMALAMPPDPEPAPKAGAPGEATGPGATSTGTGSSSTSA